MGLGFSRLSDLVQRRKIDLMRRMIKAGGREKEVMVCLVSRGLTANELHVPENIREIIPGCVGVGYTGKWWVSSIVEWLDEAGLNILKQGVQLGVPDSNLPLISLLRYK